MGCDYICLFFTRLPLIFFIYSFDREIIQRNDDKKRRARVQWQNRRQNNECCKLITAPICPTEMYGKDVLNCWYTIANWVQKQTDITKTNSHQIKSFVWMPRRAFHWSDFIPKSIKNWNDSSLFIRNSLNVSYTIYIDLLANTRPNRTSNLCWFRCVYSFCRCKTSWLAGDF